MTYIKTKETPLYKVTTQEILEAYQLVYLFLLELRSEEGTKLVPKSYKNGIASPMWGAAEVVYLGLYGYTKKSKFSRISTYLRWPHAPRSLKTRVVALLGRRGRIFYENEEKKKYESANNIVSSGSPRTPTNVPIDKISYELRVSNQEVQNRMQAYIEDFDLHSAIDQDILRNLVKTQLLIETGQDALLRNAPTPLDVKSLSDQLKNYTTLLGLSKKDRLSLGAEKKKGSIAELASVYEETLREYTDLEQEFLLEELNMLLDKYERRTTEGDREIGAKAFRIISGGFTLEEARALTGRKKR